MKIKRIKKLSVNSKDFKVTWLNERGGAWFDYSDGEIGFCIKGRSDIEILEMINHELFEICCVEMHTRLRRSDVGDDYIFVFDHRQHTATIAMMTGLLSKFLA